MTTSRARATAARLLALAFALLWSAGSRASSITQFFKPITPGTTISTFLLPTDQWFMPVFHPELPYFRGVGTSYTAPEIVSTGGDLTFQFSGYASSSSNAYRYYPNNTTLDLGFIALPGERAVANLYLENNNLTPGTPKTFMAELRGANGVGIIAQSAVTQFTGLGEATFAYNNDTSTNEYFVVYVSGGPVSWQAFELEAPLPKGLCGGLALLGCLAFAGVQRIRARMTEALL